jgi:purine-binding chemotaxis protein CheW
MASVTEQCLSFYLEDQLFGINILWVQEIRGWQKPTPLPNSGAEFLGVINIRGLVVPIVDLRIKFGFSSRRYDDTTVVIVVRLAQSDPAQPEKHVGFVVDAVSDVQDLVPEQLSPVPGLKNNNNVHDEAIRGLLVLEDNKMLIVLNELRLLDLDAKELAALVEQLEQVA